MEFCCRRFETLVANAGKRGLSLLAEKLEGKLLISLQSRGIAHEDMDKIRPGGGDYITNVATEIVIAYCPDCGTKIDDLVARNPSVFDKLAESHRPYLSINLRERK